MTGPLVLACGALVRELRAVLDQEGLTGEVEVDFLPAPLHNRPERIVPAIEARLAGVPLDRPVFLGYGDCGTGGRLDTWISASGRVVTRLPGAHCYEFFTGSQRFADLHAEEVGTFFLTDFLARNFDSLVWQGLGLDRHPELLDMYFGNYRRVLLLSQGGGSAIVDAARSAAERLGLDFDHVHTGIAPFGEPVRIGLRSAVG